MASGPITSKQIDRETMETETLFLGAPKSLQMVITAMKLRHFLLGRRTMTNLESVLRSRDITMPTKVHLVKAMIFPVVIYGCESWTLLCWRKLLRVPWTTRRSNQSILKGISPEHSLEGLMLKLKLQYSGHLMRRTDSLEKTDPDAGKD